VMQNSTHTNVGTLGEPTPPTDGVIQTNATHKNQAGFDSVLETP
jgi:hypothetical protein